MTENLRWATDQQQKKNTKRGAKARDKRRDKRRGRTGEGVYIAQMPSNDEGHAEKREECKYFLDGTPDEQSSWRK